MVRVKDVYQDLIGSKLLTRNPVFSCIFQKDWLTFRNKNLTQENLMKRGWHGPGLCFICMSEGKIMNTYFLNAKKHNNCSRLWRSVMEFSTRLTLQLPKHFYGGAIRRNHGEGCLLFLCGSFGNGGTLLSSMALNHRSWKTSLISLPLLKAFCRSLSS